MAWDAVSAFRQWCDAKGEDFGDFALEVWIDENGISLTGDDRERLDAAIAQAYEDE